MRLGLLFALLAVLAGCTQSPACVEPSPSGAVWTDARLADAVRSRIANESAGAQTRTPSQAEAIAWPGGGRLTASDDRVQVAGTSLPNGTAAAQRALQDGLTALGLPATTFAAFSLLRAEDACATTRGGY